MSQCINHFCYHQNPDDLEVCEECGTPLIFDRYYRATEIIRESIGYQAGIYDAIDIRDGSAKILKVLSSYGTPRKLIGLFQRQFWILARYKHPQIPTVAEFFDIVLPPPNEGVKLYGLLMDKIEGITLEEWISRGNKLNTELAINWYGQLCKVLKHLHSNELIHRDIKPSNIMLREDGQLILIDFGTIRDVSSTTYLVKLNTRVSEDDLPGSDDVTAFISEGYSPNEQVRGKAIIQSDFFALGRTFVHLLTGVEPKKIELIDGYQINWRGLAKHIPKPLLDLTDELIDPIPQRRPKSIEDIIFKLSELPAKIQMMQFWSSWYGQVLIGLFTILGLIGVYLSFSNYQAKKMLEEGNRYFLENKEYQANLPKAREKFEIGLRYEPENIALINNLASVCAALKDDVCAVDNFKKAITIKPIWNAYYNFGGYFDDKGDYDNAKKKYLKAIEVSHGNIADPYDNLAFILIKQKDYKNALDYIEKGLNVVTDKKLKGVLLKNKGWISFLQRDYQNAEKTLLESTEFNTEMNATYCIMAQTQEALGKPSLAWWEPCVRFHGPDSTSMEVQNWISMILNRSVNSPKNLQQKK